MNPANFPIAWVYAIQHMPTVMIINGLAVRIYPNDHRPAHVHVIGDGCEAVFNLQGPGGAPELRENFGFRRRDVDRLALRFSQTSKP